MMIQKSDAEKKTEKTTAREMLGNFAARFSQTVSERLNGAGDAASRSKKLNEKMRGLGRSDAPAAEQRSDGIHIDRKAVARAVFMMLVTFLFARVEFALGVYPFGIALLCAMTRNMVACWVGAVLGAVTGLGRGSSFCPITLLRQFQLLKRLGGL